MNLDKTLGQLVDENYLHAKLLYYLGISFYENSDKRLLEICDEKGLKLDMIKESFGNIQQLKTPNETVLKSSPLVLILEYVRYTHHLFIKDRFPFILKIAKNLDGDNFVKEFLPETIEQYIKHIYHEEDVVFEYIDALILFEKTPTSNPISALLPYAKLSLKEIYALHQEEEMILSIKTFIPYLDLNNIKEKILFEEICSLAEEIKIHDRIENRYLFPKSIELEKKVLKELSALSTQN